MSQSPSSFGESGRDGSAAMPKGAYDIAGRLSYPINSKAHLTEQLGGPEVPISLKGKTEVPAELWVRFLPAHLFPVVSTENFVEKLEELYASTPRSPISADEVISMVTHVAQENSAAIDQLLQVFRGMARQSLR